MKLKHALSIVAGRRAGCLVAAQAEVRRVEELEKERLAWRSETAAGFETCADGRVRTRLDGDRWIWDFSSSGLLDQILGRKSARILGVVEALVWPE